MYQYHTFANGIRLIHKENSSSVGHCGVFINAGTRDELEEETGMAHFLEHCIFKGTEKRKSLQILSRIDGVGGEMNAYTTKEETCIYASFLAYHYERCLELFSDILFHSTFPKKEIEKEKDVVIDEINSYKDSPAELIYDEFEELIFENHPLGRKILGEPEIVKKFNTEQVRNFVKRNYIPQNMVISSIGPIKMQKIVKLCEKYFGIENDTPKSSERKPFSEYSRKSLTIDKDTYQVHALVGNTAYSFNDKKKVGLMLLSNYLGGPAMNSRLNIAIREKYGYTYNIESTYSVYSDTGLFSIYAGMDHSHKEHTLDLILKEFQKIRAGKMKETLLQTIKQQLMGQISISNESALNEMFSIGKSYLVYDKVDSLEEIKSQIQNVSSSELLDIANEILDEKSLSFLIYE